MVGRGLALWKLLARLAGGVELQTVFKLMNIPLTTASSSTFKIQQASACLGFS